MKESKSIEMRATYEESVVVQEREGRKYVNLKIPSSFEGHTFALEMLIPEESRPPSGRFRIEFVLGNSFSNEQFARTALEFEEGFSTIFLSEQASKIEQVLCFYAPKSQPDQKREARLRLTCRDSDRQLQRLVMLIEEDSVEEALRYSTSIANQILDVLTYKKGVPLEVLRIEIFDDSVGRPVRSYIRFPYKSAKPLVPADIESAPKVPNRLRAPLRMLREATNSISPFYRCLCLYRFFEGMEKVRALNNTDAKKKGANLSRPRICVPESELTQQAFPQFANLPLGDFLDHVRKTYRLDIAHMNLNEFENLLLDPGIVGNIHRVDQVNAVLLPMARQSIQAEWDFMLKSEVGVV